MATTAVSPYFYVFVFIAAMIALAWKIGGGTLKNNLRLFYLIKNFFQIIVGSTRVERVYRGCFFTKVCHASYHPALDCAVNAPNLDNLEPRVLPLDDDPAVL
jgi:hypothetical protein